MKSKFFRVRHSWLVKCPQCFYLLRSPAGCFCDKTLTCPSCGIEVNRVR